jgi:hypothetical protein
VVSFVDGGNWSTQRIPPTSHKSPTTLSHNVVTSTPLHERNSNSEKNDIAWRRTILLGEKTYPFLSKCYMIGSYVILYFE